MQPSPMRDRVIDIVTPGENRRGRPANLWRLIVNTITDTFDDHVPGLAAEMAFFAVLSLPPFLLALLGSVGFLLEGLTTVEISDLEQEILAILSTFLSADTVNEVLADPIRRLLEQGRRDILSFGVILTLWSASRAANVLLRTVVIAYDLEDHRSPWRRRGVALIVTIVGIIIAAVVLPLLAIGPQLTADAIELLNLDPGVAAAWPVIHWSALIVVALVAVTWLYHIVPGWHTPWRRDVPGAILALALWALSGVGIQIYATNFAGFTEGNTFAGLAAPLILLIWIYVSAIAVLLGAELNAEIEKMWPTIEGPYDETRIDDPGEAKERGRHVAR